METQTNLNYFNRKVFGVGIFLIILHLVIYIYSMSLGGGLNVLSSIINPFTFFVYLFPMEGTGVLVAIELITCAIGLFAFYLIAKNWYKLYAKIIFYLILIPISILTIIIIYGLLFIPAIHS